MMEVINDAKDNYVVAVYSTDVTDVLTIEDNREVRITFNDKNVISNPEAGETPAGSEYAPIAYRSLEDEHRDDLRVSFVDDRSSTNLSNFTISAAGTSFGTITVNYPDGTPPTGTEFHIEVQDD